MILRPQVNISISLSVDTVDNVISNSIFSTGGFGATGRGHGAGSCVDSGSVSRHDDCYCRVSRTLTHTRSGIAGLANVSPKGLYHGIRG